jgi:hypothetical protein
MTCNCKGGTIIRKLGNKWYCTNCLLPIRNTYWAQVTFGVILFVLLMLGYLVFGDSARSEEQHHKRTEQHDTPLQMDSIFVALQREGVLFPEIAIRQVKFETGNLTSSICFENKNIFGIKYIRQELSIGENRGHAMYATVNDCIRDYKRLQKFYLGELGRKYAEDGSYESKIAGR